MAKSSINQLMDVLWDYYPDLYQELYQRYSGVALDMMNGVFQDEENGQEIGNWIVDEVVRRRRRVKYGRRPR